MDTNTIKRVVSFSICLLTIAVSCKKETKKGLNNNKEKHQKVTLKLPDSVLFGKSVKGYLDYDMILDTIKKENISSRYIFLHYTTESSKDLTLAEIKIVNHLTYEDTTNTGRFTFEAKFVEFSCVLNWVSLHN